MTITAFLRGFVEFRSSLGMTYDDDPYSPRSVAYDRGRDLAHRLTLRRFDT
jgi:hypothetical protein